MWSLKFIMKREKILYKYKSFETVQVKAGNERIIRIDSLILTLGCFSLSQLACVIF